MRVVLPGKPQAKLEAVSTAQWEGQRVVAYITGNALAILGGPHDLIQTIYHDDCLSLDAVAINETCGNIAVASLDEVYIYQPQGRDERRLKVVHLLYWSRLSRPAKIARFSYDASFIASTGSYDRLIKLWRRQSYGVEDTKFDFTYLSHPAVVTAIHWRKPHKGQHTIDNVLYSVCVDGKVRIWAVMDPHGPHAFQLWSAIDMQESIQPRHLGPNPQPEFRCAFIVDCHDFIRATERAVQSASGQDQGDNHALEHLLEVAKSNPEICVILDRSGHMSAWGLESIGCKVRQPSNVFNVAHIYNITLPFSPGTVSGEDIVQFLNFCDENQDSKFTLLMHNFDGRLAWFEGSLDELFDPSPREERLRAKALWTGHDGSIKKIVRSASGTAVMSRTTDNEGLIWRQGQGSHEMALTRVSSLDCSEHIHRSWLLEDGNWLVNLHHQSISLWDVQCSPAKNVDSCSFDLKAKLLCLIPLPRKSREHIHLATVSAFMTGIVWEIILPSLSSRGSRLGDSYRATVKEFCTFDLGLRDDLAFMMPVDPAGSAALMSSTLDTFAKDVAVSYSHEGVLRSWTAYVDTDSPSADWLVTSTVETGIDEPHLASGSSTRKTAVVDKSKTSLTIWDMRSGQLEHEDHYGDLDIIQDLDWSSTPDDQSILAVGFPHKVSILAQMRYDYLNVGPAWSSIREIYLGQSTPYPIGDSTWLGSGHLLIGTGNQLLIYDKEVSSTDSMIVDLSLPVHKRGPLNLFNLVTYLNGPLPVFHPQFLAQCILGGKLFLVQKIILNLHKALKFFTDGDDLDSLVSMSTDDFYLPQNSLLSAARKEMNASFVTFSDIDDPETVSEELAASLNENLARLSVPHISSREQIQLADIIECVATAEKHRRSMDDNAMRYLLFFRQHMIRKSQVPREEAGITFREIAWAYHSNSQDMLLDLVSRQFHNRMLWEHARDCGVFMWMTDLTTLRSQFETIARNEYTKTDEKNPIDCSLFYLALKKKAVLVGLWRMASWNREQASTKRLLSNDFSEQRWKTAALKNAYTLLGKRRFEYAAAFFLLAGNLQDAVNVCLHQVGDLQLAVAVARVYEGDDGPVLRALLEDKVLTQAALEGNRWLATWAWWMLGRRDLAVRTLIDPVYTLLETPESPKMQARSYLASDPALVVLYRQLRGKVGKGKTSVGEKMEWDFLNQTARSYQRMGCDLLGLDLVRNWKFLPKEGGAEKAMNGSEYVGDVLRSPRSPVQMKLAPKEFVEPDAGSLLDSFGF
ncbi:MAG: hypothetical protein LQ351_001251 [Letrouitia transgressa]|nr:MAG: hypothetical protein LQ351_001251 [Letrouitia transgressa]